MALAATSSQLTRSADALSDPALNALKGRAASDPKAAIKEAAKQFEALFMQALMKSMRQATLSSGMLDNAGTQMGTDMLDTQFATQMTGLRGGLGEVIARQLERQMTGGAAAPAALAPAAAAGAPVRGEGASPSPSTSQLDFLQQHMSAARAAEAESGIPAAYLLGQAAHESGWGRREIRNADASSANNLFGIKAGANWKGAKVPCVCHARGRLPRLRQADDAEPALRSRTGECRQRRRLRAGPATRRLCHRPGLCRQAESRDQHHLAPAARRDLKPLSLKARACLHPS